MDVAWGLVPASYLVGSFPTAVAVGRARGLDPTAEGSGNPGASNVYRLLGRRAGAAVLAGDAAKGALAAWAGLGAGGRPLGLACGAAAVVGHVAPPRGRGGRGVATAAGMTAVLFPGAALALAGLWVAAARLSGTASVGSMVAAAGLPVCVAASGRPRREVAVAGAVGAIVVLRHADNLARLLRGEEPALEAGGDRAGAGRGS